MDGGLGSTQNLRRKRLAIAAWIAVFGAANVLAALIGLASLQIVIAVLTLLALVAAATLQTRELRAEHSEHFQSLLRVPIAEARALRAYEVGVAPEAPQALTAIGRSSGCEYLPRDVDERLDAALNDIWESSTTPLVVVSGPSKAGKTRALFEAMQRQLPRACVVAPNDAEAIEELIKPGALPSFKGRAVVLWLDDLELYLRAGPHGMHPGVLEQLGSQDGKFIVLTTAGGKGLRQAGDDASQFSSPMVELLRHSNEISLSSCLSGDERQRLHDFAPHEVERIARDGIGEYMIAAPDLERKLTSSCHHPGDPPSPHGQSIAYAAIDWQRAGITDPIPRSVLRSAYASYLPDHVDASDNGFADGLDWARKPLYSTVALLSGRDELQPYDHIVTYVESSLEREIGEETWLRFFEGSTDEQAFALASGAYKRSSKPDSDGEWSALAELAIRRAVDSSIPSIARTAAFNLGILLEERGDLPGAEGAYRMAEERGERSGAVNLGNLLGKVDDLDGAAAAYRRAEELGDPSGPFNLGNLLREGGDAEGAEAAYRRAEERGHAGAAFNLGKFLREGGDIEGAEAAYRRAEERGHTKAAFNLGNLLREGGDIEGAEAAYRRSMERGHAKAAFNLGTLLGEKGDWEGAKAALLRADELGLTALGAEALSVEHDSPHVSASPSEAAEEDVGVGDQGSGDHQQD